MVEVCVVVFVDVLPFGADVPEADEVEAAVELGVDGDAVLPDETVASADSTAPATVASPPNPEYVWR